MHAATSYTCPGLLGTAAASVDAAARFLRSDKEQSGQASVESVVGAVDVARCFWYPRMYAEQGGLFTYA